MGTWLPKHVEWLCRNKTCTVLHQVGVSFDLHLTYRTANLQSCILYIYSTNTGTEYFKHGIYSPFFTLQNAVCFIILTYLVPVLFTFYIQDVLKLKKNNSGTKRLKGIVLYAVRYAGRTVATSFRTGENSCASEVKVIVRMCPLCVTSSLLVDSV